MRKLPLKSCFLVFAIISTLTLTLSFRFARYFDVECRLVPISEESKYRLDPKRAMQYIDENTIGAHTLHKST